MTNLIYSQMIPIEQNIRFQGIYHVFCVFDWVFEIFNEILIYFEILLNCGVLRYRFAKSAIGFLMCIR